jgi:hypothetical protein
MGRLSQEKVELSPYSELVEGPAASKALVRSPGSLLIPAFGGIQEGDRRDSNPRPSEPQSADMGFWALPDVAEPA